MNIRSVRRLAGLFTALAGATLGVLAAAQGKAGLPPVYVADVEALINPVSAEYMVQTIDAADEAGASAVIFRLSTPGGLLDSTRTIVSRIISAKTPVVVFVGPAGSRAASAGFLVTIAADVAVMAPGTNIGAAHPVSGTGEKMDETMAKKVAEDTAAWSRDLARNRGRNETLADLAVKESRAYTEGEALDASPPLIDFVAANVPEVIRKLDGRTVARFDGKTVVLHTAGARVVAREMSWRQRLLNAIAHPNIAYILLSLGLLGLTVELWNPGAVLPGVAGGICLLLAFFALQVLSVNYAGVLLILFGIGLFALEVKVPSYGLLSVGGIASLVFGSLILIDSGPERVSLAVIAPVVVALAAILTFLVRITIAAQRRRSVTGESGMIDAVGQAMTAIAPGLVGRVSTHGEIWNAIASEPIAEGESVRVTSVEGLMLTVRRAAGPSSTGRS